MNFLVLRRETHERDRLPLSAKTVPFRILFQPTTTKGVDTLTIPLEILGRTGQFWRTRQRHFRPHIPTGSCTL
ncbi:hypothetical protein D3C76_1627290 [compost metagenome]